MKKLFLVLAALLVLQALSAVDTVMEFSAYKNPEPPTNPGYTITVKNFNDDGISGISHIYDISKKMANSRTLSNAFYITISSNLKASIEVGLVFGPFVNQTNGTSTVPVTYTFSTSTVSPTQGSYSVKDENKYYLYSYTPEFTCNPSSILVSAKDTSATLSFNPTATTSRDETQSPNNQSNNTSADTLPGFADGQVVSATAYFTLSLEDTDYNNLKANTDYIATVGIIITSAQ